MVHGKDPVLDPLHSPSSRIVSGAARSHWKYLIDRTAPRGHVRNWRTRTKKRKVRAAHRGSVTRIVGQVYESLESGDALSVPRLRQQKSLLSGKLDVLSKLDDELTKMVAEDELEHKVEN